MTAATEKMPVDLELKRAFAELQQKSYDTYQKLEFADRQVDGIKRSILHKQITDKEMQAIPEGTKVYQGVGRCFIASSIPEVRENIAKSVKELDEKVRIFEQNKDFMMQDLKATETQLRELVASKKSSQQN